jgi:hypothetical protein
MACLCAPAGRGCILVGRQRVMVEIGEQVYGTVGNMCLIIYCDI